MDQAFILPIPKSVRVPGSEDIESNPKKTPEFRFSQTALRKLASGKMGWDEFFQKISASDPILRLVTTKEGDTILHLAVLLGINEIPKKLSQDPVLLWKRNDYGFTPLELAQFLKKDFYNPVDSSELLSFDNHPKMIKNDARNCDFLRNLYFLSSPTFENKKILYAILSHAQKAKAKDRVPPEKTWMGIYFDKEIQEGTHPLISIRFIDEEVGFGVFAEQKISSCSFVGEYTGIIQERKSKHLKNKKYCVRYTVWEMGRRNFVIDAEKSGNFTRFINHSNKPNLSLQSVYWRGLPRMIFIALKEIEEGTQFTFDYGTFFWKECQQTPKLF